MKRKTQPHNDYLASHPPRQRRVFYIHTIEHQPGRYVPGEEIYFAGGKTVPLVTSLAQIRKEQDASIEYRKSRGAEEHWTYSWQKVEWRGE